MARDPKIPEYSYARRGRPAVDPALRRIAIVAGAVSVLVIVVALAWSGLRPRLGFGGAPPEIAAPNEPLRVAPANPGGLTLPGANEQIMSGQTSDAPAELAPPPPAAQVRQLQQAAAAPPPKPARQTPAAIVAVPPPVAPLPAAPQSVASAAAVAAGPARVQLAALSSEVAAQALWGQLEHKMPDLLVGQTPIFISATVNGKSVWRLRINGFADAAAAKAFCQVLAARGAACTVAAF